MMRPGAILLLSIMEVLAPCCHAIAGSLSGSSNPYRLIAERNAFGLRPVPTAIVRQPALPLPNVILTGITTILEGKRALLKIQLPAKPPTPAKEQYCILAEGQRDGPIEVLEIDMRTSNVKINNSGTVMTITFPKQPPARTTPVAPRPRPYLPRFPIQALTR